MKRYIRTKDGKIFDTVKRVNRITDLVYHENEDDGLLEYWFEHEIVKKEDIIKQAETIEGLIELKDLGKNNGKIYEVDNWMLKLIKLGKLEITEFYTKQGNNYVLVWTKERGVI